MLHALRSDVEDHVLRTDLVDADNAGGRVRFKLLCDDRIDRKHNFAALGFCLFQNVAGGLGEIVFRRDFPTGFPIAARNVLAIPPPMIKAFTLSMRLPSSSSLVETLAPPTIAATGRCGRSSAFASASSSACMVRPANGGSLWPRPSVEA